MAQTTETTVYAYYTAATTRQTMHEPLPLPFPFPSLLFPPAYSGSQGPDVKRAQLVHTRVLCVVALCYVAFSLPPLSLSSQGDLTHFFHLKTLRSPEKWQVRCARERTSERKKD